MIWDYINNSKTLVNIDFSNSLYPSYLRIFKIFIYLITGEAPSPYMWGSMVLNILQKRYLAACALLNQDTTLWLVGGEDGDFHHNTSEFITLHDIPIQGPQLPFTISGHGIIKYKYVSMLIKVFLR